MVYFTKKNVDACNVKYELKSDLGIYALYILADNLFNSLYNLVIV